MHTISKLVLAVTLIVYGLINLGKIDWQVKTVWWLLVVLGVLYVLEVLIALPNVKNTYSSWHNRPVQNQ